MVLLLWVCIELHPQDCGGLEFQLYDVWHPRHNVAWQVVTASWSANQGEVYLVFT